ncbi:MAG: response regulator [Gammaproteobacteria bacterium]|nr:response regulator [Gammaproteobacteria bacterium]
MEECNILFIIENKLMADELVKEIKISVSRITIAENAEDAVAKLDEVKPNIILFYTTLIADSQAIYFTLYKKSKFIYEIKHRPIVLCNLTDIDTAHDKCIREVFFDYVVVSARFDRIRINLSLRNALKSMTQEDALLNYRDLTKTGKQLGRQNQKMATTIGSANTLLEDNKKTFDILSDKVKNDVNQLSNILKNDKSITSSSTATDAIDNELNTFSHELIEKTINESKNKVLSVISGYTNKLESGQRKINDSLTDLDRLSAKAPKKILIIEDNEVYGDMVRTMLEKEKGYDAKVARTIHQGMVSLIRDKPDLVLLDYELEDADAVILLEKVSALPAVRDIPIIMLTSHDDSDVYTTTLMLGAREFINKPASKEIILEKIQKYI